MSTDSLEDVSNDDGEYIEVRDPERDEELEKRPTLAETLALENSSDNSETSSTCPESKEDKRK
jgi:hypothetical protein